MAKVGTSSVPKHFFAEHGGVDIQTGLFLKRLERKNDKVEAETRCGKVEVSGQV